VLGKMPECTEKEQGRRTLVQVYLEHWMRQKSVCKRDCDLLINGSLCTAAGSSQAKFGWTISPVFLQESGWLHRVRLFSGYNFIWVHLTRIISE